MPPVPPSPTWPGPAYAEVALIDPATAATAVEHAAPAESTADSPASPVDATPASDEALQASDAVLTALGDDAAAGRSASAYWLTLLDDSLTPADPTPAPMGASPPPATDPTAMQVGNAGGSDCLQSSTTPAAPAAQPAAPPPVAPASLMMPPPAPVANPDNYAAPGGALTVGAASGVLANDSNPTGQPAAAVLVSPAAHGSLSLHLDGSFSYTAYAGFSGMDSFGYQIDAGGVWSNTALVYLNVTAAAPTANNDAYAVSGGGLSVPAAGVLANDASPGGQPMTASLVAGASHGSVMLSSNGAFTYYAGAGYSGADSFTYVAMAGAQASNVATVTLNVSAGTPPTANDDAYAVSGSLSVAASGVMANDTDPSGQPMTASIVASATHGMVSLSSNGAFTYYAMAGYSGADAFTYHVTAGGMTSNTATVTLNVTGPPPTANDDAYTVSAGDLTVPASGVLANDANPSGQPMTASIVDSPANGVALLNPDGSFEYDADPGFLGTDSLTYTVTANGQTSNVATVTFDVTGYAPPAAADDAYTVNGPTLTVAAAGVLGNDTDPTGQGLTPILVGAAIDGNVTLNPDGSFSYTANPGYVGADRFAYEVTAGGLTSNVATVSLDVIPPTPPTAADDSYAVNGGVSVGASAGVTVNDIDPDGQGLTATLVSAAASGTVTLDPDGGFSYVAYAGFVGTDAFTYTVTADGMTSNVATVTLAVSAPVAPTAADDGYALPPNGGTLTVSPADGLLGNDLSPSGLPLNAVLDAPPANGTLTLGTDGSFAYTPNAGTAVGDRFTYHVTDGMASSATATVTLSAGDATVGGFVWLDGNADGLQSPGESGVAGVTVDLFDDAGSWVTSTTTDSTGHYIFTSVASGASYYEEVVPPAGDEPTAEHAGPSNLDSDVDAYGSTDTFYVGAATSTTLDAGEKPAAAAAGPKIYIYASPNTGGGYITNKLRVAKWENAFEKVGLDAEVTVKDNFTTLDPDHFYIQVVDNSPAANKSATAIDKITVRVKTSSDTGNNIVLVETGVNTGVFNSADWLLLTSFVADDKYPVNGVEDNTDGDPVNNKPGDATYLVKLGDTVTATYTSGTTTVNATATVPIQKVVKLHITILRDKPRADGGTGVTTFVKVDSYLDVARQVYAQVGIAFKVLIEWYKDPPAGVNVTSFDYFTSFDGNGKMELTGDETKLLGYAPLRTPAADDVEVYFVKTLKVDKIGGVAYIASTVPDAKYADSIVEKGDTGTDTQVLAHELGHILMDNGDHPPGLDRGGRYLLTIVNLMAKPFDWLQGTGVADSRRITAAQAIFTKRPNLVK